MSTFERLVERFEGSHVGRRTAHLGMFSPAATLRTFSPGAQSLLGEAEVLAERALHVARGFLTLALIGAGIWIGRDQLPIVLLTVIWLLVAGVWYLIWRYLARPRVSMLVRCGLILFDIALALRVTLFVQSPAYGALGAERLLRPDDAPALTGAMLVLLAASGAFRLDPRLALLSTALALASHVWVTRAFGLPPAQAIGLGAIILVAGAIGAHAARVFRHLALKAREEEVLERYVPEALTRELARTGEPVGAGRETEISVLIVDIRGYTRRTERLTPAESVAFLNDYFRIVVDPLARRGAVLDKYIGDGVFTFFEGEAHAERAIAAARDILAAVDEYNATRPDHEPLVVGVAVHSGQALVGTIGSIHKREYTAIADTVNVTSRLEDLNKRFGSRVVASETALRLLRPELTAGFVGPEFAEIRGRDAGLAVYFLP